MQIFTDRAYISITLPYEGAHGIERAGVYRAHARTLSPGFSAASFLIFAFSVGCGGIVEKSTTREKRRCERWRWLCLRTLEAPFQAQCGGRHHASVTARGFYWRNC